MLLHPLVQWLPPEPAKMKESTTSGHKIGELYFNLFSRIHTLLLCSFFYYSYSISTHAFSSLLTLVSFSIHTLCQPLPDSSHSFFSPHFLLLFYSIYTSYYDIFLFTSCSFPILRHTSSSLYVPSILTFYTSIPI